MIQRSHRKQTCLLMATAVLGSILLWTPDAHAQESTCQSGFQSVMGPRAALLQRIQGFREKRPTPQQACSALTQLVAAEARMIKWMTENKDWCSIPDETLAQARQASGQAARARGQACTAASRQSQAQAQARRQQQGGAAPAPAVGSGVRLPQGAL